ncbi:MAG: hypothetical protein LC715_04695 [Gammaproteobacteria bacterium]|nr:hypothetical protein [Gammaproteobacteria bacterium]
MIRSFFLLLVFVAGGCSAQHVKEVSGTQESSAVSICSLSSAPEKFIGKAVRLKALYKTDNAHYEYLIEHGCAGKTLNIGNIDVDQSASVKGFYDSSNSVCAKRHEKYICVLEADLDVTAKVVMLQSGKPGVDLLEVHDFSFK